MLPPNWMNGLLDHVGAKKEGENITLTNDQLLMIKNAIVNEAARQFNPQGTVFTPEHLVHQMILEHFR